MSMKIYYWNCAAGLLKKLDYVRDLIKENDVDLFFIAEAELRYGSDLGCLTLSGYDLITSNTFASRGKSRLVCYKKQGFESLTGLNEFNDILVFNYKSYTIVGLYRGFKLFEGETELSNFLRLLLDMNKLNPEKEIVVVGDFNIDQQKNDTRLHKELNDWILEKGLSVMNTGITRARLVNGNLQESELDIVITNSIKINLL